MATKVEARMTPQGKKYMCLVMGDGQYPPNISLRTAEAVVLHLEDVKRFVEKKVELCNRFGVPLPMGQAVQSESNWQQGVPQANPSQGYSSFPNQGQNWQGSPNQNLANTGQSYAPVTSPASEKETPF